MKGEPTLVIWRNMQNLRGSIMDRKIAFVSKLASAGENESTEQRNRRWFSSDDISVAARAVSEKKWSHSSYGKTIIEVIVKATSSC